MCDRCYLGKNLLPSVNVQKLQLVCEEFSWEHVFELRSEAEEGIKLLKGRENIVGSGGSWIRS